MLPAPSRRPSSTVMAAPCIMQQQSRMSFEGRSALNLCTPAVDAHQLGNGLTGSATPPRRCCQAACHVVPVKLTCTHMASLRLLLLSSSCVSQMSMLTNVATAPAAAMSCQQCAPLMHTQPSPPKHCFNLQCLPLQAGNATPHTPHPRCQLRASRHAGALQLLL